MTYRIPRTAGYTLPELLTMLGIAAIVAAAPLSADLPIEPVDQRRKFTGCPGQMARWRDADA